MVLIVDDNAAIVKVLAAALEGEGYRVETAANGVQAYELVRSPDCKGVILDINMPKINGIELLMLMQAEDITVPAIVMAGFDDFDEEELKNFSNVVKYLHKPFELNVMLETLRKYARPPIARQAT